MLRILFRNFREKFFLLLPLFVAIWVFLGIVTVIHHQEVHQQIRSDFINRRIRKSVKPPKKPVEPLGVAERFNPFRYLPGFHRAVEKPKIPDLSDRRSFLDGYKPLYYFLFQNY